LAEHSDAITKWRDKLPEQQKRRLIHPLSVTRRWKASLAHGNSKSPQDLKRNAAAAWRRFVSCCEALSPDQALPLWRAAQVQAAAHLAHVQMTTMTRSTAEQHIGRIVSRLQGRSSKL
jgi:hypothetical protein